MSVREGAYNASLADGQNADNMKISSITKIEEFVGNHEVWYVCKNCHYSYDLRKTDRCPQCGKYSEMK